MEETNALALAIVPPDGMTFMFLFNEIQNIAQLFTSEDSIATLMNSTTHNYSSSGLTEGFKVCIYFFVEWTTVGFSAY